MHKTHHFAIKNPKIFWGGGTDPTPSGEGDTPSPHPTSLGAKGASILAPSALNPSIENFWLRHCTTEQ